MTTRYVTAVAFGLMIGLVSGANVAHAGIITYTNRATWAAAASPNGAENFNGFGADATFQNVSVAISNGTVTGEPGSNGATTNKIDAPALEFGGFYSIDGTSELLGDVVGSQKITINFTSPVTAWGADFKGVADGGRTTRIDVYDSSNTLLGSVPMASDGTNNQLQFYGFTVTMGAASRIELTGNTDGNDVFGVDNIQFTTGAVAAVPEPSTFALFALGGAGLAGWRRWRKPA